MSVETGRKMFVRCAAVAEKKHSGTSVVTLSRGPDPADAAALSAHRVRITASRMTGDGCGETVAARAV